MTLYNIIVCVYNIYILSCLSKVSRFRNLYRHAGTSKKGNINRLKQDLEGKVDSRLLQLVLWEVS